MAQLLGEVMTKQVIGFGPLEVIGVVFVSMKLMGHLEWSWWLVLLPFYWPVALFGGLMLVLYVFGMFRFIGGLFK